MPFYRFHVRDPINRVDGPGHDGAALADDIDATLFAAGVIQRLVQHQPSVPRDWSIEIIRDSRRVGVLPFEKGCQVMLRPEWTCDQPLDEHQGWR
ncbi:MULTISPECIES: hypothetical protein [Rhodopseudomonas]|uniref:DUF6894 domain-containing protein n=1 Tax=Rhodopseudomonas palustris TaxID=1076 RepID=A0A0D7E9C0_RHOPL|nr:MULTISPECIES: hypothetical protein [Rhodopseudomonas]KIZ37100.1 hypothetical protein OO17_23945 [Rhodopseudomonas palustris]MDF3810132.1 hypothetical protein [Rhodopseudomonas sp. BAL398]WOK18245.1 hypothetical protein RBJ75_01570 [Rhodopseudomonas sp. BAL398]